MLSAEESKYRERLGTWLELWEKLQDRAIQCIPANLDGAHPYVRLVDRGKNIEFGYSWRVDDHSCGKMPVPYHLKEFATGKE
jgi:hypothetical protein